MSSYLRVLRHRNFRSLFLGQAASAVGDYVVLVALALFITRKTGSPTDVGLVLAAGSLPMVALLLFGGVWADRLPRHRLMISADAIRAVLHTLLAALIFTGSVEVWQVVVIEALFGAATAFFQPAYTGLLPQTVPEREIQDARALTQASQNVASLSGPALATVLVLGLGPGYAFAFDGVTKLLGAALLVGVRPRARGIERAPQSLAHELRAGWREVMKRPWVWVTIAVFGFALMFVMAPWDTLAPTIARRVYGGAGVFGVLVTVEGVGAVCAAVVGARWKPARPLFTGLLLTLVWPLMNVAFALTSPLALLVAISFATGFTISLLLIWWEVALAQHIPPHVLSRVSAYDWMGSSALLPIGFLVAGPVAAALGAQLVLGVGGAIGFLLLGLALLPRSTRELRSPRRTPVAPGTLTSPEQLAGELQIAVSRQPEIANVDPFVGAVHERAAVE